jgi:hypothetical protein
MSNRKNKILNILNEASNPNVSRISELHKLAASDQHGIFQHFQSNVADDATREKYLSERGGEAPSRDTESLYNLSPEHKDSKVTAPEISPSLSTRYSPDRVGVQARRIGDGIMQDPYTNKIYDYNEGFKTEDGREFPGGSPSLQTDIMNLANHLDDQGLVKEANWLDAMLKKAREFSVSGPNFEDALSTSQIADVLHQLMEKEDLSIQAASEKLRDVDSKTPWVRELLGLSVDPVDSVTELSIPAVSVRTPGRLMGYELEALMRADRDQSSSYKFDVDRTVEIFEGNLSAAEEEILASSPKREVAAGVIREEIISLSNLLDERGLYKDADRLDAILKI